MTTGVLLAMASGGALVLGYLAFVGLPAAGRRGARAALALLCVLVAILGYSMWREARAVHELAAVVAPFPAIDRARWVPSFGPDRYWLFHAAAPSEDVRRFYADARHRAGWTLVRESDGLLVMRNHDDGELTVLLTEDPHRGGTALTYALRQERPR